MFLSFYLHLALIVLVAVTLLAPYVIVQVYTLSTKSLWGDWRYIRDNTTSQLYSITSSILMFY